MGEQRVSLLTDKAKMQEFVKALLKDVQALEYMLENDWFESDITRIGAEQEMVLIHNDTYKPATLAMEALEKMKGMDWVETELAKFNLETNMFPRELTGDCFSSMDNENTEKLTKIQEVLGTMGCSLLLTGILPTLRKFELGLHNLTPKKRYRALMDAIDSQLLGSAYELRIVGIDELMVKHDSPMLEACNTSFQVHLQVSPNEFVKMYNIAQALAAPTMAIAANSPIVFGKRLWHETRIALFQQSLDTRSVHDHLRERSPRVNFGKDWLQESIMEIYKEDIARFRVLISSDLEEDALGLIKEGKVPKLRALQVHNSTVYRWNRPCYGISDNGKPHLRIENRVLPSGPSTLDEIANACFWLGCMVGMADEIEDIRDHVSFADVSDNFGKAAKFGIDSKFTWFNDEKVNACDLVLNKLIPLARKGLTKRNVKKEDIDKYLSVIEGRAQNHMNGARWALRAYTKMINETSQDEALTAITAATLKYQSIPNHPVHKWDMPDLNILPEYKPADLTVSEFMSTDLFTVQKDDIIDLVAEMMDWRKINYTAVEDTKGKLVGLVSSKDILRYLIRNKNTPGSDNVRVEDIMNKNPRTVTQDIKIVEAMRIMRDNKIGCLPVVKDKELVGVISENDFLRISNRLIERLEIQS